MRRARGFTSVPTRARRRARGMSLVEILVGVAIGLIGTMIITEAYLTNASYNRAAVGAGGAQTNGLTALYTMQRDIAMAGFGMNQPSVLGCGTISWYYNGNYSPNIQSGSPLPNIELAPVYIDTSVTPNTVTVMYSSASQRPIPATINTFVPSSSEVTVNSTTDFNAGDLVLLVNHAPPQSCTMAEITQVQASAAKLQMNPGSSGPYNPPSWGSFPANYGSNDMLFDLGDPSVRTYSIATPAGAAGKYRLQATDTLTSAAGGTPTTEDVADGIVDLRAQYGMDDGANGGVAGDGIVDEYTSAQPTTSTQWGEVLAVRIGVLARVGHYERPSTPGGACSATTVEPTWEGGSFTVPDGLPSCYHYRVFQTVVPLRNMIWTPS